MALDGMFLHHIVNEIKEISLGARVQQIYQPNKDEIIIVLRTLNGSKKLLLSSRANTARMQFTEFSVENPPVPPMLCMLMRKKLGGGKLIDIRQQELDRIVFFDFECIDELGDKTVNTIVVEIMGNYSNVILVNQKGVIIDALKRVDLSMSSQRLVLPNIEYEIPLQQDKANIITENAEEIVRKITDTTEEKPLNKSILNALQGASPIVCREIEHRVNSESQSNKNLSVREKLSLLKEIENLSDTIENLKGKPIMLYHKGDEKPFDITFFPIAQYGDLAICKEYDTFSQLLDGFYSQRDSVDRMRVKSADLTRLIANLINRVTNKISVQLKELQACENREQLRMKGDLLQANLYRIEKGAKSVVVENFYDENYGSIEIKLNPAKTPAQNAQKYYKDYNRAKTAEQILTVQIEKGKEELEYLESLKDTLSRATTEKELNQIRLECIEQGYIKRGKGNQKKPTTLPPLEYKTTDGFKVLVGRNNKQNDLLTLKTAKNYDVWFHTKDIPGSHTIVLTEGREITETAIFEASQIAAYHSKGREGSNIPVDYTLIKYVSKPKGSKPGMVIFTNNKTLFVDPKLPENQ